MSPNDNSLQAVCLQRPPTASRNAILQRRNSTFDPTLTRVRQSNGGYKQQHLTSHSSPTTSQTFAWRAKEKHGAVILQRLPPSRLHKSSTPWLLAMVVCGVWVLVVLVFSLHAGNAVAVGLNSEVSGRRRRRQMHEVAEYSVCW